MRYVAASLGDDAGTDSNERSASAGIFNAAKCLKIF